jgi:hypothetical protein
VIGGTINTGNMIIMRATRVGSETVLSQIVRLVEHAQLAKAPIQVRAPLLPGLGGCLGLQGLPGLRACVVAAPRSAQPLA